MLKRLLILPFILILFGCSSASQQYKTEEYVLDIPNGWIVESRADRIPDGVSVVFLYREVEQDKYYSINLVEEKVTREVTADDYYKRNIELASEFPNFEKVSEDKYSFDGVSGIINIFNSTRGEDSKKIVVQGYIFSENLKKGYILTGILEDDEEDLGLQNILDLLKSFSLIQKEASK